jgi:hypothetical protein
MGDASPVGGVTEELEKNYPSNTLLNLYWLPTISAAIHHRTGYSSHALVNVEAAAPFEPGPPEVFTSSGIPPTYASKTCGHETEQLQPRSSRYR